MGNLMYGLAIVLIITWAVAFLGYNISGPIHILPFLALAGILWKLFSSRKS